MVSPRKVGINPLARAVFKVMVGVGSGLLLLGYLGCRWYFDFSGYLPPLVDLLFTFVAVVLQIVVLLWVWVFVIVDYP